MDGRIEVPRMLEGLPDKVVLYLNNLLLYHMVKINFSTFLAKAGAATEATTIIENKWKPLKQKTIDYKKRKKLLYSGSPLINIRTKALLMSLKPGWFRNGLYIPRENQVAEVTTTSISFYVIIDYADRVDAVRPIYIRNMDRLATLATEQCKQQFENYVARYYRTKNPNKQVNVRVQ